MSQPSCDSFDLQKLYDSNNKIKNILKNYSTYDINKIFKPLIDGGLLEVVNDTLQIGENPTTANTLPGHIQLQTQPDDKVSYTQSLPFQCDLSDIIQSNIKSHLKKQPLEQVDLIKKFKDNPLLSHINSELIIEELNKMVDESYIEIDGTMYKIVIY